MSLFSVIKWLIGVSLISTVVLFNQLNTNDCGVIFESERRGLINNLTEQTKYDLKTQRSVSVKDYCQMSTASLTKSITKISHPKPDHPDEAQALRYQQQLSDNQQMNAQNWNLAREQVKNMRKQAKETSKQVKKGAGISSVSWEGLGPGNIGGRVRSIAFDPEDSNRMYAGAVAGGVWLTEDAGLSWSPTDDFMANLSVTTLIFDPSDSDIIYAGTGEGTFNFDYIRGLGIFKSTDKGASWSSLDSTRDTFNFYWVNRLTMLGDGSRILAATHTGIWISDNAGDNWSQVHSGRSNDVNVHPTDDLQLVAGTWGSALYSSDGGLSWSTATGLTSIGGARVEIAYSQSNPEIVYASIDSESGEIYKSEDGGQSYTLVNTGESYLGAQGWYDNALWVDPFNPDHIIVGGIDLWRSIDGGVSLTKISTWWLSPTSAHADHHFIIEDPNYDGINNKRVYFANDGGVYTTEDVTQALGDVGWQALNNNLSITQFYGIGVAPDETIIGGTQDNGTLVYKGDSENWTETFGGDGGFSAADPTDSNYLYGEYVNLQIHRSTNGGISSSYIDDPKINVGANFIAPFILDPNNENRLLGGSGQLWVSDNAKAATPTWVSLKDELASRSEISAIAVEKGDSNIIYVGHNNGSLFKTTNGTDATPDWTALGDAVLPQRYLMRVVIDPLDSNVVYVSFGGYETNNLWKSVDGGVNWNIASGVSPAAIPPAPIRAVAVHPTMTNQIYVGTEVGIFTSEDGGATWNITNDGPANVSVDELVWGDEETLYAATHGRGIFKASVNVSTPDNITFESVVDAELSVQVTTAPAVITGLGVAVEVTVSNGEYSIGCSDQYTAEAGTINNDDVICLRHTTSDEHYALVITQITIGTSTFDFESRTLPDITPDEFSFEPHIDAALDVLEVSNAILVSGISNQADISIVDGEYSIGCGSDFVSSNGSIQLNDTVCVRHVGSSEHFVTTTSSLTIGDFTSDFESTTLPDTTPEAFSFSTVDEVEFNSNQQSETVTITGFQVAIPISITNGEYSIGCASENFSSTVGEISPNETVCVRHTSETDYFSQTTTTLDVNGVSAEFTSITIPDRTPDDFSFSHLADVEISSQQISSTISLTGIAVEVDVTVVNGEYSIGCTSSFTSVSGRMSNGDTLCVRHTSSNAFDSSVQTTVNIGTISSNFTSTTKSKPRSGGSLTWLLMLLAGVTIKIRKRSL